MHLLQSTILYEHFTSLSLTCLCLLLVDLSPITKNYHDKSWSEYIHLEKSPINYNLAELPMGKYIVCGEAMVRGTVYQASCFETRIERLDNNSKCYIIDTVSSIESMRTHAVGRGLG